uniref:CHAD domain-containing protein n=1 Tax=Loa loa TaxID=7209 RepID=A0A1I7VYC6_LOALO
MNLNKLASEVKLVLEKAENICTEETLEELNEECKSKSISLERKRKLMIGHLKIIEEIIPKVSALEKEWKEALHSVEIKDEDYEFDLYESYLNSEECLFSSCHKMHYVRTLLTEEIGQINLLCEKEEGNERAEVKSSVRENEGKLTELIEKLFEEAIDRREDITATRKFAHLLGCLKGEALEHISDLAVSEENYALAMKNLKERYGDKQRRIMELYTRLQKLDKSERNVVVLLRELLNILSQLKELGENLETNQLWTTITGKLPDYILGNVIKEKLKKPEWTMQDTITFLKNI